MVNVEELRDYAAGLLEQEQVKSVIGFRRGTAGALAEPCTITSAAEAASLVWDPTCLNNLALYLVNDSKQQAAAKTPDNRPVGIVAKGCDSRAVGVLLQENYFKREDVVVIGVSCEGTGVIDPRKLSAKLKGRTASQVEFAGADDFKISMHGDESETVIPAREILADRCLECRAATPKLHDVLFGEAVEERGFDEPFRAVKEAEKASEDERWATWGRHFDRCLRCFACRSVCPMCYCPECVVDSTTFVITPATSAEEKASRIRWCERSANTSESAVYLLTRAIHLAGRCVDCGECERVCPVNIPLRLLNTKLEMEAFETFEYQAGYDIEQPSLLSSFRDEDPNSFIR
ncbi:hydrogenase [Candidatus Endoriftia persephone str. Guaymas]|jgi:ferredoxin|uniref:Coenzyme F420 hydrogenase/dehydrogenase, beta subunit C-terminal domain n=3 Tax=Gammaproteobacteria TaxID=1236 RepID=A0A9J6ZVS5_9GAMM|nr:4Fe-4S dicluster domain-containing protein [Candidatus Endoriftia persephone]EGV50289.1 putative coenzyme F420-reducing hydrogenase, beta subunit [endosymbiont of Riftia pachyptila (vent Ph05)]EGW53542.1 putative coenzyme F420-reducing hydrogenase, beta subunit [endosymbiont of Tevnia jerichonana (vent Tica)]MBA1331514.1 hydrogenase [Candidatus Endoriftia persephone str. Guaymas]USF86850.1 Coenzyme F420 hydrogenase/dehydrogenase, beta subunit C-terminal domain [Candidatus Endoriftia persepho